uniref:Uncharacterized protein n=1 Tax=Physcomitrium patens TaxID=3218 RepID=A0A2K1KU25_PHYPA|nr:hypothetical protein PHYPA_004286 [Physcomitrium patens]
MEFARGMERWKQSTSRMRVGRDDLATTHSHSGPSLIVPLVISDRDRQVCGSLRSNPDLNAAPVCVSTTIDGSSDRLHTGKGVSR